MYPLPGQRVWEPERTGTQQLGLKALRQAVLRGGIGVVLRVAQDGEAGVQAVQSKLMGPARTRMKLQQTLTARAVQYPVFRASRLTTCSDGPLHFPGIRPENRRIDDAGWGLRRAKDGGTIGFFH